MKKKFSTSWISSKKPRKQRKYRANAPLHLRRKFLSAHLAEKLREELKKRSVKPVTGDKVKIMNGSFKGITGKITKVNVKKSVVYMKEAKRKKVSGAEVEVPLHPSNIMIVELNTDDKKRVEALKKE